MKKTIALILVSVLCVSLCSCKSSDYKNAVAQYEAGEYAEAIAAFEALGDYKDSIQKIDECKYGAAVALMESGNYEEAIAAFEAMGEYKDCFQKIEACKTAILDIRYDEAIALIDTDVVQAYEALAALCGHKDSNTQAKALYDDYFIAKWKTLKDGDTIYFGSYEQDNNKGNGQEPIEWIVIGGNDSIKGLMSKHGLFCYPFERNGNNRWGYGADIQKKLNDDFLNQAFSKDEQNLLMKNDGDYVWLPTKNTVENELTTEEMICLPTAYAIEQGALLDGGWWWTMDTKTGDASYAVSVMNGRVTATKKDADFVAVRPVIQVNAYRPKNS